MLPTMASETDPAAAAYERFAGAGAIAAGVGGIVYSVAFLGGVVEGWAPQLGLTVASIALMVGGFLSVLVLVALYRRLLDSAAAVALLGLMLVAVGATGAMVHGGYDLANTLNPPITDVLAQAQLPSPIDPRGLLTFGVSGIGLFVMAWLTGRTAGLPKGLSTLGYVLGVLSVILYLGRLIVLSPRSPLIFVPALLAGFVVYPLWYVWAGLVLWRGTSDRS